MSINVLERTREIGVLRAIGAPNRGVERVFIQEGITIGVISWFFSILVSFPLSLALNTMVGNSVLGDTMPLNFSIEGVLAWLAIVIILSALASFLPARSASRLTVREVLAYE
jgi:putative ABC transport system permease protein